MINTNKFQTQLTDEYINSLKEECRTDLLDMINNVEFIQRLISPDRKYAKDLERDSSGKIKIDLVNPHIITDSNYFRQAAIHFQKHGCYTKLMPNPNPQSEYGQWLKREVMRCWNGMVRESDGEWVTGDMYFYLNYFPIIQTKIKKGSKVGERVIDFPEMWEGVYWRFHYWHQARYGGMYDDFVGGKHCIEIASRGRSKSYSFGSKLTKNFVLGENELNRRNVKSLVAAYQKEYLIKDGTLNKFIDGITHCAKYTQFPSARLKASMSDLNWKAGFIDTDTQLEAGTLNEVLGVAVKDDSDKLRGKRSSWLGFEEFAAFAKFLETWQTCMPNVQEGDISFGQMSGIGTGGSSGNDFMGALEMLNYPDGYRVYSLPNYWDKGAQGKKKTVFFYPGYVNSKGYYNEDGVSDVVGALISEIEYRINLKYNSSDPLQLTRRKAETAFTIQDAIMKRDGSLYPTDKLNDVINEINLNPKYTDDMWIGRLSLSKSGEVEYKPDNDLKYITEFPHKDNKIEGAICIRQMPIKNSSGAIPWGRYISGCDTADDDGSETTSLFSMFIMDLWTDEIVFEYTGRPMFMDDAYENARLACIMYNCEMNYENNKKGLFKYFSQHNSLYLLSDTLEFLKDKEMVKSGMYGNKAKGTGNYGAIAPYARRCIRDYLLKSLPNITIKEVDGNTVEEIVEVFNYQKIWSKGLLQELAMYSVDGNFDRHDALAMLMLLREDKLRLLGDTSPRDAGQNRDVNYLGKDKFFENNYRKNDFVKSKLKF